VEAYYVTALKRCDLFDNYPDCKELDHFGEEINVEQEEEEDEVMDEKILEDARIRMEEMRKRREDQKNNLIIEEILTFDDPTLEFLPEIPEV